MLAMVTNLMELLAKMMLESAPEMNCSAGVEEKLYLRNYVDNCYLSATVGTVRNTAPIEILVSADIRCSDQCFVLEMDII